VAILVITIISLPLLAAAVLALYALALIPLRALPAGEYAQAVRAPLWLAVLVSGGMAGLALVALLRAAPVAEPAFVGWARTGPVLLMDAYTLWAGALLGAVLAAAAWVPAARRSLGARAGGPAIVLLLALWCALLLLAGLRLPLLMLAWLALLVGVGLLWLRLGRPLRGWADWGPLAALGLAALLALGGLGWLHGQLGPMLITEAWSSILTAAPRAASGAMLLVMLGWLGPAVYLPWWLWRRRDEPAQAWLPAALLVTVVGPLALARLACFLFPRLDVAALAAPGIGDLFLVRQLLIWLQAWGWLALLLGGGWLVAAAWRRRRILDAMQPLPLAASGLLLLGLAMGLRAQSPAGVASMLWLILAWAGTLTIALTAGSLLDALTPGERTERWVLAASIWVGVAMLVGLPPGPVYRAVAAGWESFAAVGAPRPLLLLALAVIALCAGWLLPRWLRARYATAPRPGAGWGILAPVALALLLLAAGCLAAHLQPIHELIRRSLLQAY